ncbi:MAG TPA: serine--tRNA ligase [Solirubrobacteraceae bacterium]|nr:serine--tRNA ligase [Solirubrobacteraceae bacterium]
MLDIKLIRQQPDAVRQALARRGADAADGLDRVIELDERRRAIIPELEALRARRNAAAEAIAQAKRAGEDAAGAIAEQRELGVREKELTQQLAEVEGQLDGALLPLPNLPDPTAAPGPEDELVRVVGEVVMGGPEAAGSEEDGAEAVPEAGRSGAGEAGGPWSGGSTFTPRDHLELAGPMIDMDHAAKLSGARFAYLKGDLVLLELALVRWVLEKLRHHGFEPVVPPVLVRERALFGTGFLPDTEQQIYRLPEDELYLVGTSEVALASLHDEEILDVARLPVRYAGFSPCFRREAGAAGKDTRGIFRVHQFDKVEMFSFVEPPHSGVEHERILAIEEEILGELALPYRVVNIAVGDLGASAAKKYDCEAWLPSQGRYRELTSCSNTTDYQARRLNIRARRDKRTEILHTLNGTAVAVGRTIIALLENGQREDGSVALPTCLHPFGAPSELLAPA